jgi:hypothetical protein
MMNLRTKSQTLILASLLCAALAGVAMTSPAQSHPRPAASSSSPGASSDQGSFTYVGRVTKVEYAANSLVLATKGGRVVTITVTPTTSIDAGGGPGSIADIRPGGRIRVEGFSRGDALIAVAISVL